MTAINAQTISSNNSGNNDQTDISFYGNENKPNSIGGEYIIFQEKNKVVQGLVYIQNSDIFSCFKGQYDSQNKIFKQLTFAYPEMESNNWIETPSEEKMSLRDFPHHLNEVDINQNTSKLFNECLDFFKNH